MTIYGTGYRSLDYQPTGWTARLWPVATNEVRSMFRPRFGVWAMYLTLLVCCFPFLLRLFLLAVRLGVAQFGPLDRRGPLGQGGPPEWDPEMIEFYLHPVVGQSLFGFVIVTCLVSCRAMAKDRVTDALEIYWTRGITPRGYFLAKWFGSVMLLGALFVGLPLVVWIIGVFMAPDWGLLQATVGSLPRLVLALVLVTVVLSYLAVAFSALAGSPNLAIVLWLVLLLGSVALGQVLSHAVRGESWYQAISPWESARRLAEWITGVAPTRDFAPVTALLFLGGYATVLTALMQRRLRLVEAVS